MRILTAAALALSLVACGSDIGGNYKGTGSLTAPGQSEGIPYNSTANFTSSNHTFTIDLILPALAGSGTIGFTGTYATTNGDLVLSNEDITISASSGTVVSDNPTGYVCANITVLQGAICFDTAQHNAYTVNGSTLTIEVSYGFLVPATSTTPASVSEQAAAQVQFTKQ